MFITRGRSILTTAQMLSPPKINTWASHKSGKSGPKAYDINSKATLASLHAGIGETHLKSILSVMNIPPMSRASFKARERETGKAVEAVAKVSCEEIIANEKKQLISIGEEPDENNLVSVPCSYDMGWQKRGKGFNSNTGQAATMSQTTGKILIMLQRLWVVIAVKTTLVHLKPWSQYLQLNFLKMLQNMALNTPHIPVMMTRQLNYI